MLREVNRIQNNTNDNTSIQSLSFMILNSNMYPNGPGLNFTYFDDNNNKSEKFTPNVDIILKNTTSENQDSFGNWYYSTFKFNIFFDFGKLSIVSTFNFYYKTSVNKGDNFKFNPNYDTYIKNDRFYKLIKLNDLSDKFKLLFKDVTTYLPNTSYKCIELVSSKYTEYDPETLNKFNTYYKIGYLVENGDFITPYADYDKISGNVGHFEFTYNTNTNTRLELPLTTLYAYNFIPSKELIDACKEKKLLSLKHNYSSPKIYKLNYLFYGGELNYA